MLDEANNWEVVCFPHARVFDYSDEKEKEYWPFLEIDPSTIKVYQWPAGIPVTMYHYKDKWLLSSSRNGMTMRIVHKRMREKIRQQENREMEEHEWMAEVERKFWSVWEHLSKTKGYQLPSDTSKCYMFKLGTKGSHWADENVSNRKIIY